MIVAFPRHTHMCFKINALNEFVNENVTESW